MKNKGTWIIAGIVVAFVVLITGIFVTTNNRAISLEEQVLTADSDVQMQEKRRTDLVYNLVDCVKEYDKHEADTLLAVVDARNNGGVDIENVTTSIAAVAEQYPELKSNENYKELMNELSTTENLIAQYRQVQVTAYREFLKLCNGDVAEAARQTAIYMSAMINPVTRQKDDAGERMKSK